ncbi:uncharacterized protein L969DRAFT_105383 [Mixia osmundae IAM 14324]|uniref:Thioredoxin domain-containing protein n=1 Tax=Mixia osmundae (strain CBS 9802 / IAM 14324 / JCM 22182 / KY 12970) TaxID=764103 RepID=G7DSV7_MIXOS|nr:uncharacterized protein L969DRAFT_105383 [Mixia osmundae IAM 14324]KEI37123.1 hypothetical protein L969DRAFT_105383 [Mixia osmundae IAM 14324]GAA93667.1 hypothetical protein E5Q_00312 [Mixia osmundae IAM 14324]
MVSRQLGIFATLCLLLAQSALAGTFGGKVKQLGQSNFKSFIAKSDKVSVAVFYAPWCGHCKNLAPHFEKAADNLHGLVNFLAVDCDEASNKPLCGEYGIQGFPTLKAFSGKGKTTPRDYQGARTAKAIADYAVDLMPSWVKRLQTGKDLKAKLQEKSEKPQVILFTKSAIATPLYKALSTDYYKDFDFHLVKDNEDFAPHRKTLSVEKVPQLTLWDGEKATLYTDAFKYDKLNAWFKKQLKTIKKAQAEPKDEL